jgi:FAD/FMN-containing dehydrogenase
MRGVEEIDPSAATMTVLAGTTLQQIQEAAARSGFDFPLDMGSRGSAQIGGVLATNAGGIRVVQSGTARDQVLGLEVVLADGAVLSSLNKAIKNNTGYDLKHWFIGSEGTLGVITRAVLRLRPKPAPRHAALCALRNYAAALRLLTALRTELTAGLAAFEIMWADFFDFGVSVSRARTSPFGQPHPLYALIEQNGPDWTVLEQALESGVIADAVIPQSAAETRALWEIREATAEFAARLDPLNFDISLPIGDIGKFVDECRAQLQHRWPGRLALFFGHIGDSNLHVTLDCSSGVSKAEVDELVYSLTAQYQGSISAEHGIGLLKRDYLRCSRSEAELRAMWAIKKALDPRGILNRGKLLPAITD